MLQVLDISTLGDPADVNPVINFLPHTLQHLKVDSGDFQMFQRVWQEFDYRVDICRVTNGGRVEHL
jgi:hypothetical protein